MPSDLVLVTGATGYIGQHVVRLLANEGLTVRGFSRRSFPSIPGLSDWYQGDITRFVDVHQAVQGCKRVIHLACLPLGLSEKNPIAAFQINVTGTLNVLQAAYELGNIPVIYTSTAQVYGQTNRLPMREDNPVQANSPYAASKLCGEVICQSFADNFGVPITILRLFNVFGLAADGNDRPTVETVLLKHILKNQPPTIKGSPQEGRDFIHVNDVARCIQIALDGRAVGEVINVGTGVLTTLDDLAWQLIKLVGSNLEPIVQLDEKKPMQIQADTAKATQILGFSPQISLEEGLAQIVEKVKST